MWPAFVQLLSKLYNSAFVQFILAWVGFAVGEKAVQMIGIVLIEFALMVAWGVLLGVFWTYFSGTSLRELFKIAPLTGAPAGALYLASHAFPLKFLFGVSIAYIQWRITLIPYALAQVRIIRFLVGS